MFKWMPDYIWYIFFLFFYSDWLWSFSYYFISVPRIHYSITGQTAGQFVKRKQRHAVHRHKSGITLLMWNNMKQEVFFSSSWWLSQSAGGLAVVASEYVGRFSFKHPTTPPPLPVSKSELEIDAFPFPFSISLVFSLSVRNVFIF